MKNKCPCEDCELNFPVRKLVLIKGKMLCHRCRNNDSRSMMIGRPRIPIDEVISKDHRANPIFSKDGNLNGATINLPIVCAGKKFKLIEVKE